MADTSWEYIIDSGTYVDTSQGFEPIADSGTVIEGVAAGGVIGTRFMSSNIFPTVALFKESNL